MPKSRKILLVLCWLLCCLHCWLFAQSQGSGSINKNLNPGLGFGNAKVRGFCGAPPSIPFRTGGWELDSFWGEDSIVNFSIPFSFNRTSVSPCDQNGNVLFYSNGFLVGIPDSLIAINGDSLSVTANSISSSLLVIYEHGPGGPEMMVAIPNPGDSSQFILVHTTHFYNFGVPCVFCPLEIYASKVELDSIPSQVVVFEKNSLLLSDTLLGSVLAVKHANGRDWWVVIPTYDFSYYAILIYPNGILVSKHPFPGPFSNINHSVWQCNFSQNGDLYAFNLSDQILLYDFDRCSGLMSNMRLIPYLENTDIFIGCSFSPDGHWLYASNGLKLWRYDVTSSNPAASRQDLFSADSAYWDTVANLPTYFNTHFLSQDGTIKINSQSTVHHFSTIKNPNAISPLDINFEYMGTFHRPTAAPTKTNHPNYFLGPVAGSICDSLNLTTSIKPHETQLFEVYPNPSKNALFVRYNPLTDSGAYIKFLDAMGKEIKTWNLSIWTSEQKLTLPELPPGVYMATLYVKGQQLSKKIIIE